MRAVGFQDDSRGHEQRVLAYLAGFLNKTTPKRVRKGKKGTQNEFEKRRHALELFWEVKKVLEQSSGTRNRMKAMRFRTGWD